MAAITFHPGSGVKDKAEYRLGRSAVPQSVVTRLLKSVTGKTGLALDRAFYQGMVRYEAFLESMEENNITPSDALKQFQVLKPAKTGRLRIEREAEGVAKILAKKYSNLSPKDMVEKFVETANQEEFKNEVINILKGFEKKYKRNAMGRIKTSDRKGNMKAIKALSDFRSKKLKVKK